MAIYVREAGFGATPCVTRARSALSSGFAMTTQTIRFYRQGSVHEISGVPASRTVLQHLREDLHCTGTKEGCAEGDCGACTVVIGELDARGTLALKAVNACIQFLPTLDGKALFTVEDLRAADGSLHPVQQAMVDCHGSQCGFCTPGFVMSMWALYESQPAAAGLPTRDEINTALSGNLCRCTGYRPIVDAAQKMFDYAQYPRTTLDREAVETALRDLQRKDTFEYRAADARGAAFGSPAFYAPVALDAFAQLRAEHPEARLVAGSTDVGLWVTKQFRDLGVARTVVSLNSEKEENILPALDRWAELPPQYKALFEEARPIAHATVRKAYTEADEKNIPLFKKKLTFVKFTPEEIAAFRKAAGEPVWEEWVKLRESQGIPGRELLNFLLTQAGVAPKS